MAKSLSSADIAFLSRINGAAKSSAAEMPESPSEAANEKSLARLEREYMLLKAKAFAEQKAFQKVLGGSQVSNKIFDANKAHDRLSGDNSGRIFLLLIPAVFFDVAQFALGLLGLIIFLAPVVIIFNYILLAVSSLVFFFMWQHFDISLKERYIAKKGVLAAVLNIIRALFPILEALPFFPGITLNVIISIIIVRQVDKARKDNLRLQNLKLEIGNRKLALQL